MVVSYPLINVFPTLGFVSVNALKNTSSQRNSYKFIEAWKETIELLREDVNMQKLWESYQKKFDYALNLSWDTVIEAVVSLGVLIDSI